MSKSINILDKDYLQWIKELGSRYRRSQIKAAVKVNEEMLRFYWELGRDIVEMHIEDRWGEKVIKTLSLDLQREIPEAHCFSRTNLYYVKKFYLLYSQEFKIDWQDDGQIVPQLEGQSGKVPQFEGQTGVFSENEFLPQVMAKSDNHIDNADDSGIAQQVADKIMSDVFSVPWGHHKYIIDKFSDNPAKALFYVHQTVVNGWSRNMLLNFFDTDLYERQGKALTNFSRTLPDETSDLAQELTKDPYDFAFTGITGRYNERLLKDALLNTLVCSSARRKTAYKPNMPWSRAASRSASRNTSLKNSIPRKWKERYRPSGRLRRSWVLYCKSR